MSIDKSEIGVAPVGLDWTGERYLPEVAGSVALEHLHRYAMAKELVRGKQVLDIASGEGYGSNLLSAAAGHTVGVDLSAEAVEHATLKYGKANLEFRVGSCAEIPMPDHSVDVVVSFETIEHHDQHEAMMGEIKRVLRPDGVVIISSPEKHEYSDVPNYQNPYHVKELYRHEFEALLSGYFKSIIMYGQRIVYGSGILLENAQGPVCSYRREDFENGPTTGMSKPLYLIALASDVALPPLAGGLFEGDIQESELARHLLLAIQHREKQIQERDYKIEMIMNSHSWKLTAPFRFVQDKVILKLRDFVGRMAASGGGHEPPAST